MKKRKKKLSFDPTDSYTEKFKNELISLKEEGKITPQLFYKFSPRSSLYPKWYGLPKRHKPNLPLRPIVASTKSPTSALSKWLALLCKPLMSTLISYIKNSPELVKKTKRSANFFKFYNLKFRHSINVYEYNIKFQTRIKKILKEIHKERKRKTKS